MNVWIVNPFDNLPLEGNRPQRYWLMARAFVRAGHRVTLWTSDFSHATKARRVLVEKVEEIGGGGQRYEGIEVRMIPTLPYPTNVCLARIRSHHRLARDFERQAMSLIRQPPTTVHPLPTTNYQLPTLIIASTPPLGLCAAAMRVARACGAKFVCDIQDAWPETFERVVPRFVLSLVGMRRTAKLLYCGADGVSAVAARYLELAKARGGNVPMREFGHCIEDGERGEKGESDETLRLVYAGNMSLSYDLATVIEAVRGLPDVTLDIAGNGPDRERLEKKARGEGEQGNVRFHGYLGERELAELLRRCDVGIVPMFPESCVGVPGKLADYAAAGLRVVECLGGECQSMVERYGAGGHYEAGDMASLRTAVGKERSATVRDPEGWRRAFDATAIMDDYVKWCVGL